MNDLLSLVRQGNQRATARLISEIENDDESAEAAISALYKDTGMAHIIGITGPPGSGKSTLVSGLARAFHDAGHRVGVIAVDPSSPFTGGALLGDRVRMADLAGKPDIFVRSMASRGTLGGLAQTTAVTTKILDAAGYDVVLIETVGAGQAEVDIAAVAHTVVVVEAPGMGDEVQSIKAGILEIADILVVNKADRPGAQRTVSALEVMLHMGKPEVLRHHGRFAELPIAGAAEPTEDWEILVLQTVATENRGLEALCERIQQHRTYLQESGAWLAREKRRSRQEIERILQVRFAAFVAQAVRPAEREALVQAVAERDLSPYAAAATLLRRLGLPENSA